MKKSSYKKEEIVGISDFSELLKGVKSEFTQMLRVNINLEPFSTKERMKRIKKREEIREALRNCISDQSSKILVKYYIKRIIIGKYGINEENIGRFIKEDAEYKFKRMLLRSREEFGREALERLIEEKFSKSVFRNINKEISEEEIDIVYANLGMREGGFPEKVEYLTQKLYEQYKGNGVIDDFLDLAIDGISSGVSGIGESFNVWIMFKGNTIRLSFLKFEDENEVKRICRNLCKSYGMGQLSEKRGYLVAELKDGSRTSISRPPFCETWSFFIRKFKNETYMEPEDIIFGEGKEEVINLLKFLVKGERLLAITGEQGSGKTTLLASLIKYIPDFLNIRVSEMSFELHLRKRFPKRNIVSFRETDTIGVQESLDFMKKTDGNVTILGEVATMQAVLYLVQVAQNASSFTLFTHHAKDTKSLIYYIRNALLMQGRFSNEKVALLQAIQSVRFNVRMSKNLRGERLIESITEIVPSEREEGFIEKEIVLRKQGEYILKNELSRETKEEIYKRISVEEEEEFLRFLRRWQMG